MDPVSHTIPRPGERIGPYRVLGELGRGGMAIVVEVEHVDTGARRALKLMLPGDRSEEVARRMEREFLALSRLNHPSVLKVYEAGRYQGRPWFSTEVLDGEELRTAVEGWRTLAPADRFRKAEHVLARVAEALVIIHDQGLVHRDVTPSNIMLLRDGSLRLMDFGVVKEAGAEMTQAGEVVGTVAYIAPEQIIGGPVDARADLYALGAVLYLMLTGRRPFNARNLAGYLDKHLNRPPRPPRELAPTLPERLDAICLRLLEKEPDARFASARHLLLALDDRPLPGEARGEGGRPLDPGQLPVTGRARELGVLREAVNRLLVPIGGHRVHEMTRSSAHAERERPPGGLVIIDATDGMGKSRLASEAMAMARQVDVAVTRVRGTGDPRPWSGFRSLLEGLDALPGYSVPDSVRRALAGAAKVEAWSIGAAARDLVEAAGPRLVIVDDAHRVDRSSLDLVAYLYRNLVLRSRFPLLLVLTRDPSEPDGSLGRMLAEGGALAEGDPCRLSLGPVPAAAVEELLLHLVVDDSGSRALAARLAQDGEGNPFFIAQMLRGLVAEEVITGGDANRRGELVLDRAEVARAALPVPGSIRQALLARLAPLGPEARAALDVLAVAREPLDDTVIGEAAGLGGGERLALALGEAHDALLVSSGEAGAGRHVLARHRLADVLVEDMSDGHRADLHSRLARALERCHRKDLGPVVAAVADHFAEADHPALAWPYLLDAARQQSEHGDVADSLATLDRALLLEPRARAYATLAEADRRLSEALQLRAAALVHTGEWAEAKSEARRALELARDLGDDLRISRAAAELGGLSRRRHDLDEARQWLELALSHARRSGDRRASILPLYELGALHWSQGDLDGAREEWVGALASAEALSDERMQALGANGLGVLALCRGDAAEARRQFERAIGLGERHGMAERLVISRINLIELHHLTGNLRKGAELADRTVADAREVGNAYGIALGLRYRALVLADLGRLADARENALEAARMQRALGNPEEELPAYAMAVRVALYAHDLDAAEAALAATEPLLAEHDTEGFAPIVHAWRARVLVERGEVEAARLALDRAMAEPGRPWPHQRIRVLLTFARTIEALGDHERATSLAEEALRLADASGYRLYAMRARHIAGRTAADANVRARHLRVADALERSLAANLPREDGEGFLELQRE